MQILSTLAFMILAITAAHAEPERKLLRAGDDSPMDLSDVTDGGSTTQQQEHGDSTSSAVLGLPCIDPLTKSTSGITSGEGATDGLLPSGLPSTDALSSITKGDVLPTDALSSLTKGGKNILPTDLSKLTDGSTLSSLTGGGGLDSITSGLTKGDGLNSITDGIKDALSKGGKLSSLPGLPIAGSHGADATKGLSGITDSISGLTGGLGLESTSTSIGKPAYSPDVSESNDQPATPTKPMATPDLHPVVGQV